MRFGVSFPAWPASCCCGGGTPTPGCPDGLFGHLHADLVLTVTGTAGTCLPHSWPAPQQTGTAPYFEFHATSRCPQPAGGEYVNGVHLICEAGTMKVKFDTAFGSATIPTTFVSYTASPLEIVFHASSLYFSGVGPESTVTLTYTE